MFKPKQFRDIMLAELALQRGVAQPRDIAAALQRYWDERDKRDITLANEIARIAGILPEVMAPIEREVDRLIAAAEGDAMRALLTEQLAASGRSAGVMGTILPAVDADSASGLRRLRTTDGRHYRDFLPAGEGGMGIVYWALDTEMNRQVAFKVVRPDTAGATRPHTPEVPFELRPPAKDTPASEAFEQIKARFLQEAWITGAMEHPGIVPVYELGETPAGIPFYTMRFVRGSQTLASSIEEVREASIDERLRLLEPFLKVCDTLRYAHSKGIIHRDLKPANIALGEFGETVVLDWGLASLEGQHELADTQWQQHVEELRSAADVSPTAGALGTPGYMSPEATLGRSDQVDERSDVYSLGAILFEILTGYLPFEFRTYMEYATQVAGSDPRIATDLAPDVPRELSDVCASALRRDKVERTPDIGTLLDQIRAWQARTATAREVDVLIQTARSGLEAARDLAGDARVRQIERVGAVCQQVLAMDPDSAENKRHLKEMDDLREMGIQERDRATRRTALRRFSAAALVVVAVATVIVANVINQKREEAVEAQRVAVAAGESAEVARGEADRERERADDRARVAKREGERATEMAKLAAEERDRANHEAAAAIKASEQALAEKRRADEQAAEAQRQGSEARDQAKKAEVARQLAVTATARADREAGHARREAAAAAESRDRAMDNLADSYAQMAHAFFNEGRVTAAQLAAAKAVTIRDTSRTREALGVVSTRAHPTLEWMRVSGASQAEHVSEHPLYEQGESILALQARPEGHGVRVVTATEAYNWAGGHTKAKQVKRKPGDRYRREAAAVEPRNSGVYTVTVTEGDNRNLVRYLATPSAKAKDLFDVPGNTRGIDPALFLSTTGVLLFVGAGDGTVRVWDARQRKVVRTLRGHPAEIRCLAASAAQHLLVVGASNSPFVYQRSQSAGGLARDAHDLRLWDYRSGRLLGQLEGLDSAPVSVAFSPDGNLVYGGGTDGTICVWNAKTQMRIQVLRFGRTAVKSLSMSPGGSRVAAAYGSVAVFGNAERPRHTAEVVVWRVGSGRAEWLLRGTDDFVDRVQFGHDESTLYSAGARGSVCEWRLPDRARLQTWRGNTGMVLALTPVVGTDRLVSASGDISGTGESATILWDSAIGAVVRNLEVHTNQMSCQGAARGLAFSKKRRLLYLSAADP